MEFFLLIRDVYLVLKMIPRIFKVRSIFINTIGTESDFSTVLFASTYLFGLPFHLHQIPIIDKKKFEYLSLLNYIISLCVND